MDGEKEQPQKLDVRKRSANVTEEQKTLLLQFIEDNPRLMCGTFAADFTYKDATILWKKVTDILNSCNGINKDWKFWRKCWQDLRSRSKIKQSKINAERRATGGGSECILRLTKTEEATLNLINPTSISGHVEIMESDVQIQPENETNCEMDKIEYLDENMEYIVQQDVHHATSSNVNNNYILKDENKENTPPVTCNLNENSNDSYVATPPIRKNNKSKVDSTLQPTQILADVAKKTYEMQSLYYENKLNLKKQKLELTKKLVNIAEKCNPS